MLYKYIFFAVIATITNILVQAISFHFYQGIFYLQVAMLFGTGAGLVLKYILDKKFVFSHTSDSLQNEGKTFSLYTLMGVFTTFIFWGVEAAFHFLLDYDWAKYVGAVVGLGIGYVIKFHLDKRFVFSVESRQ
ncbi:GtrA family protein [Flexithrix dorotheae]|uniref:GtrA family protein n=1 Tax=Flexithrix dorotheae TaxID=70993 RepID=UPI00037DBB68|nr:GtrA family protein [Flexithrix dorotheae]